MEQGTIIGISVAVAAAVIFGVHSWLHRLIQFKMDESAILNFFRGSNANGTPRSTNAISAGTDISVERVTVVCNKSTAIMSSATQENSWHI